MSGPSKPVRASGATSRWVCRPCAQRLGLSWGNRASSDGGWCGAGGHRIARGERLEFHTDIDADALGGERPPSAAALARQVDGVEHQVDEHGQMGLL